MKKRGMAFPSRELCGSCSVLDKDGGNGSIDAGRVVVVVVVLVVMLAVAGGGSRWEAGGKRRIKHWLELHRKNTHTHTKMKVLVNCMTQ